MGNIDINRLYPDVSRTVESKRIREMCWKERKDRLENMLRLVKIASELADRIKLVSTYLSTQSKYWSQWPEHLLKEYGSDYQRFYFYSTQATSDIIGAINAVIHNLESYKDHAKALKIELQKMEFNFKYCFSASEENK